MFSESPHSLTLKAVESSQGDLLHATRIALQQAQELAKEEKIYLLLSALPEPRLENLHRMAIRATLFAEGSDRAAGKFLGISARTIRYRRGHKVL